MLPYWLLFALWTMGAVQTERRRAQDPRIILFAGAAIVTMLLIGLRFEVGGDWTAYLAIYNDIYFLSLPNALAITDPGYALLNWMAVQIGQGIVLVNLICAAIFTGGVARLAWQQPNPALAMLVAVPYLFIVVAMGYTRQAAAIGVICFAVSTSSERHLLRLVVLIGVAALLHKTAILILPIALRPIFQRNVLLGVVGGAVFLVLFVVLLSRSSDQLMNNYVNGDYDSQGALIRVLMNVGAAGIFWFVHKRIDLEPFQKRFWMTCAVLAIVSVLGLAVASASSGIDRLSLYLIPLQMIALANLPYALGPARRAVPSVVMSVVGYCLLVQYVWLNHADNAAAWLPYRSALG